MTTSLEFRKGILADYPDVYTPEVLLALEALAPLNERRRVRMAARTARRQQRADAHERIAFLDPAGLIPGTQISVAGSRKAIRSCASARCFRRAVRAAMRTRRRSLRGASASSAWRTSGVKTSG